MAFATDIHAPRTGILETVLTALRQFRISRLDKTTRQWSHLERNGQSVEQLALKIGFGV